ncbi:VWA domain-containing protein [Myxococcota bacterium]|nr:VWA domain-containing protein [Myxococcota bacterium]MBU1432406.1 VWA domain-containing protein [Myxococcota bacterium]MBU1899469.1 VWA domain-containing protein [Myxococcota bacterium]
MFYRRAQRGGFMAVMMVELSAVIALFMWAAIKMGYYGLQVHKNEDAADAIAMAMMHVVMVDGLDAVVQGNCANHPVVLQLLEDNLMTGAETVIQCPEAVWLDGNGNACDPNDTPEPTRRGEECHLMLVADGDSLLRTEFDGPDGQRRLSQNDQAFQVIGGVYLIEERHQEVVLKIPQLVLTLDYSGSMNREFQGGQSRLSVLQASVRDLLGRGLNIFYGLVIFNSDIETTVPVGEDNLNQINNAMNRAARLGTIYSRPLGAAMGQFTNEDSGYYILFVTDGTPEDPGQALGAADQLRRQGVTIYTLNVVNPNEPGGDPPVGGDQDGASYADRRNLLIEMSGNESQPGNPNYYFEAANPGELQQAFAQVVASIVCTVPLRLDFIPPGLDPWELKIFIQERGGNDEIPLEYVNDLASVPGNVFAYQYSRADNEMRLSEAACTLVDNGDADLRIRLPPSPLGPGMGSPSGDLEDR